MKQLHRKIITTLLIFLFLNGPVSAQMKNGIWRGTLVLPPGELPFSMEVKQQETGNYTIDFINGTERITADEITFSGDSIFIRMPFFDSEIRGTLNANTIAGRWINYARKTNHVLLFSAKQGIAYRFPPTLVKPLADISGRWEVDFSPGTADSNKAIGVFVQKENHLSGTFLTPTGDYRYLEGNIWRDTAWLSCFDGSHAFLFRAVIQSDGTLRGDYWSGLHWHETWTGRRNEKFELPDPDKLTFLKEGYTGVSFRFPDTDSNFVSPSDPRFTGKVTVVQILGSWCPNCMDETNFLAGFYKKYNSKGFEVIGLSYERAPEFSRAAANVNRLKKRFDVPYPVLIAALTSNTDSVSKSLPMLNKVMSFPTTIFIDKKGKVRKIHTGFSGPATGAAYEKFKDDFTGFIEKLLSE